MEFLKIND